MILTVTLVLLVLVGLKLSKKLNWSWWLVLSPVIAVIVFIVIYTGVSLYVYYTL